MTEPEHKGTKQFLNAVSERFSKLNPAETSDLTQAYEVLDGYLRISEDHEDFDEPKAYLKSEKVGRADSSLPRCKVCPAWSTMNIQSLRPIPARPFCPPSTA